MEKEPDHDRARDSLPVLKEIKHRLDSDLLNLPKQSKTHAAVSYMLNQWGSLSAIFDHPAAPLDNNPVEQVIRPTKLGAKNWLFIGHPKAGRRCAILYTILQNCHLSGHNPQEYLLEVLNRLAREDRSDPEFISSLAPKNWKPAAT